MIQDDRRSREYFYTHTHISFPCFFFFFFFFNLFRRWFLRFSLRVHPARCGNGRFPVTGRKPRTCWRRAKSGTGIFDRRSCTAGDASEPVIESSQRDIHRPRSTGSTNMASSEIVKHDAATTRVTSLHAVLFTDLSARIFPLLLPLFTYAILLLFSERYIIRRY